MSIRHTWPQVLEFFGMPLVIEPSQRQLSSDAALLLSTSSTSALDSPKPSLMPSMRNPLRCSSG
jgi:hypothetical protein